ncbi:uncharacterized protein LOC124419501 [Lucilia cuprina]|uniref:uncharacterized protein LOC124419501 n=1 Tax=Lucilia cuprina TaxID=7375 RepID=UPI001F06AD3E|nr:uncharacterized protein LOC124419501 [Lucilia cuprina]
MEEKKESCPAYPVRGFIISGDPTSTATVMGCGKSNATVTQTSQAATPGQASLRVTGVAGGQFGTPRLAECKKFKKIRSCSPSGEVPLDFSASTSKAAAAQTAKTVKNPASGTVDKGSAKSSLAPASQVPIVPPGSVMVSSCPGDVPPPAKSGNQQSTRHKKPSKRAATTRRSAYRIIELLGSKPPGELTTEQSASLQWAKTQIAGKDKASPPAEVKTEAAPKRQRSEEEAASASQQLGTKRPKQTQKSMTRSFSEVAKDSLVRAVIDRSDVDGSISQSNWDEVKQKLMGVFWQVLKENPGTPPQCDDAGWFQGHVKLMTCADERSALLLKSAISLLGEVWGGSKLDVVTPEEIPRRPRSIAKIPSEPSTPEEILEILKCCNPQLPTNDWKVVRVSEADGSSRHVIVVLNKESLEPLRETKGKVYYGFGTIFLHVYRSDSKGDPSPKVDVADDVTVQSIESTVSNTTSDPSEKDDAQSVSELMSKLSTRKDEEVDDDDLLGLSQEIANVDVVTPGDGEIDSNQSTPL